MPMARSRSLAEAVKLDPRLAPAHVARAWLLHRLGRDDEALPHLEAALTRDDVRALDQIGVVLLSLDRVEGGRNRAAQGRGAGAEGRGRGAASRPRADGSRQGAGGPAVARRLSEAAPGAAARCAARSRHDRIGDARSRRTPRPGNRTVPVHGAIAARTIRCCSCILAGLLLADGQREEALREYRALEGLNGDKDIWAQAGRALAEAGRA